MSDLLKLMRQVMIEAAQKAKEDLVAEGRYFEDEQIVLKKETVDLFKEIEAFQKQIAIDKALDERDEVAFMRLTSDSSKFAERL